jgi:cysteine desulfurase
MHEIMGLPFGNPSSPHSVGESTRSLIEDAREQVADLINANSEHLIFTSCGSEANNQNVICSQTSACVSRIPKPSFVLTAYGLDEEEALSSLRFSFSSLNTTNEAMRAAERVIEVYKKLKSMFIYE